MAESQKRKPPKGGRKGGSVYPRINLKKACEYAHKLVSKTHTAPQPANIIFPGVFDTSGSEGNVRASALKQYDLLQGTPKAYQATQLARDIGSSPPEECPPLLQKACLTPKIFRTLYDTFQNDQTTLAKIRQQAINQKVHPDSADECVKMFIQSLEYSKLAKVDGENITISPSIKPPEPPFSEELETEPSPELQVALDDSSQQQQDITTTGRSGIGHPMAPSSQVNINVDSSMDPEKLEKLLKLLKQYRAI